MRGCWERREEREVRVGVRKRMGVGEFTGVN
jgi:hypothetical protein